MELIVAIKLYHTTVNRILKYSGQCRYWCLHQAVVRLHWSAPAGSFAAQLAQRAVRSARAHVPEWCSTGLSSIQAYSNFKRKKKQKKTIRINTQKRKLQGHSYSHIRNKFEGTLTHIEKSIHLYKTCTLSFWLRLDSWTRLMAVRSRCKGIPIYPLHTTYSLSLEQPKELNRYLDHYRLFHDSSKDGIGDL